MDAKTLQALNGSIIKWAKIVTGEGEDKGTDNCPLCKEFFHNIHGEGCEGCPVKEATGRRYCEESPYEEWHDTFNRELARYTGMYEPYGADPICVIGPKTMQVAIDEHAFLVSLLPK